MNRMVLCVYLSTLLTFPLPSLTTTTYLITWSTEQLTSINNRIEVCLGDSILVMCYATYDILWGDSKQSNYDNCHSDCEDTIVGTCSTSRNISVTIRNVPFLSCESSFSKGKTSFILGETDECSSNNLRLQIYAKTDAECNEESTTTTDVQATTTQSSLSSTSNGGGQQGGEGTTTKTTTGSTATSNGNKPSLKPSPPTQRSTISSPASSVSGDITSVDVSPTSEGVSSRNQFFVDYSTGQQIAVVVGAAVVILICMAALIIPTVIICLKKKSRVNVPLSHGSKQNIIDDTDSKSSSDVKLIGSNTVAYTSENNKSVISPHRQAPPAPQAKNGSNVVARRPAPNAHAVNKNTTGSAPVAPTRTVSQSVKNYNNITNNPGRGLKSV